MKRNWNPPDFWKKADFWRRQRPDRAGTVKPQKNRQVNEMSREQVIVYYGKIGELAAALPDSAKKGERETYAGRRLLRYGLENRYGMSFPHGRAGMETLEAMLEKGAKGKPCLKDYRNIGFNISHSGDYAVCAFSAAEVGADIQIIQPWKLPGVLSHTMSLKEQEQIAASLDPERTFCTFWSRKESYLKWTGEGIGRNLTDLDMGAAVQQIFYIAGDQAFLSEEEENAFIRNKEGLDAAYVGCLTGGDFFEVRLTRVFP